MSDYQYDEQQIERHLLGQLPEDEEAAVITRRTTDAEFDQWCELIEDELIDKFVRGSLSPFEAARFEERYLVTPERREKVAFARTMLRSMAQSRRRRRAVRKAGAFAIAAVAILGAALAALAVRKQAQPVMAYVLVPGVVRGAQTAQEVRMPPSGATLKLRLRIDPSVPPDRAAIRPVDSDANVWTGAPDSLTAMFVDVSVPSEYLQPGDYILVLSAGSQSVASFFFRVRK